MISRCKEKYAPSTLLRQYLHRFARQLEGRFGIPVVLVDERGSSVEAQKITGNAPDDAVAAAIILQRYFDAHS